MFYAKALLFIHDNQTQVAKLDVLREQPVGPDRNVHFAFGQIRQTGLEFLG